MKGGLGEEYGYLLLVKILLLFSVKSFFLPQAEENKWALS